MPNFMVKAFFFFFSFFFFFCKGEGVYLYTFNIVYEENKCDDRYCTAISCTISAHLICTPLQRQNVFS